MNGQTVKIEVEFHKYELKVIDELIDDVKIESDVLLSRRIEVIKDLIAMYPNLVNDIEKYEDKNKNLEEANKRYQNDINRYNDDINRYKDDIEKYKDKNKKLKEENSKLKKESKSSKVITKKPVSKAVPIQPTH